MATWTLGGVMRGYCAIGRKASAMPPTSVITTESTVAKIGRSMKKREIMAKQTRRQGDNETRRQALLAFLLVSLSPCLLVCLHRLTERRHRRQSFRLHDHLRPHLLQRPDHDPILRSQLGAWPRLDDAPAVGLQRPGLDAPLLYLVVGIDDVEVLDALFR